METTIWVFRVSGLGLYCSCIGIMESKTEATIQGLGLCWAYTEIMKMELKLL